MLLWDFDIIPAPAAAVVRPKRITSNEAILETLPPVDPDASSTCNCFDFEHRLCLVGFHRREDQPDESGGVDPLGDLLACVSDSESNPESYDEEDEQYKEEEVPQSVECFPVVGSDWEKRYQDGLKKCYDFQVRKQKVQLRVEHEPDNISDFNALKFEVLSDGQWFIIGYCRVKKIPKLKRALHHCEVVSLELCNLRRIWYPPISEFRFAARINIVKIGRWERDDPNDQHNSNNSI